MHGRCGHIWDCTFPRSGDASYILTTPFFQNVTIHREIVENEYEYTMNEKNGNIDINIIVHNHDALKNIYVVNCTLNGQVLESPLLTAKQINNGGMFEFWMSDIPSHSFWRHYS